jgi:transposase-like protein
MGGESAEAWRTVLDDLIRRGLRRPEFLIVDTLGLDKAIAAFSDGVPVRNLLAHAPVHDEVTAARKQVRPWPTWIANRTAASECSYIIIQF